MDLGGGPAERPMMSRRAVILTFMIGGPLLWLPVFLAWALISGYDFRGQPGQSVLLSPALGGFVWCLVALLPRNWLYTWIPTLGTALLYGDLVRRLPLARLSCSRVRTGSMVLHLALAATISAVVFSSCLAIGALLGLHAPLLPTAQTPHDSFGIPNLSLSSLSLTGMVSIIGGILGAVLGALWPAVVAPAADDVPPIVARPPVLPPSPSRRLVFRTFFVIGPLLYMPLISILLLSPIGLGTGPFARPFAQLLSLPVLAFVGAIVWYSALLYPSAWLQTWIPALATAFLFWAALARLSVRRRTSSRQAELGAALIYMMICGALSVIVFALCQSLDGLFTHDAAVSSSHGGFTDLLSSAAGHTVLMAAAILGVLLGGAVYVLEIRESRRLWRTKERR